MRLPTRIAELRGKRTFNEIAQASGVNAATVRQIEAGRLVSLPRHIGPLEQTLGAPVHEWYPPAVLLVLIPEEEDDAA